MKAPVFTSPAVAVRADTPVAECIRRMRELDIGSVVVVSDDGRDTLVGIFTERDLLRRIDQIQHGGFWENPVRTVMTQPVRTITTEQLPYAGKIMLKHGFRHLPVVAPGKDGKPRLAGIVTMRDLFRRSIEGEGREESATGELGVLTRDEAFLSLLKAGLDGAPELLIRRLDPKSMAGVYRLQSLLIDIDRQKPQEWAAILRSVNRTQGPPVTLLYNPLLHTDPEIAALRKLAGSARFAIFTKPVDVTALFGRLAPGLPLRQRPSSAATRSSAARTPS